jgi:hypothetical protein
MPKKDVTQGNLKVAPSKNESVPVAQSGIEGSAPLNSSSIEHKTWNNGTSNIDTEIVASPVQIRFSGLPRPYRENNEGITHGRNF